MAVIRQEQSSETDPANGLRSVTWLEYDDAQDNLLLRIGGDNQTTQADFVSVTFGQQTRSLTIQAGQSLMRDVSNLGIHGTPVTNKLGHTVMTWPFSVSSRWPA